MIFKYLFLRDLERYAPWADLSLLREKIIEHIRDHVSHIEINSFVSGETPCLPNRIVFINVVRNVVYETYNNDDVLNDPYFDTGKGFIVRFFTSPSDWGRVSAA